MSPADRQAAFFAILQSDPTAAVKTVQGLLRDGDFYRAGESSDSDGDPGKDTLAAYKRAAFKFTVGSAPPKLKPEPRPGQVAPPKPAAPGGRRQLKQPPMASDPVDLVAAGPISISRAGAEYIVDEETGGRPYWERHYSRPYWPEGASGVTIGVGFDLGYYASHEVRDAWGHRESVDEWELAALRSVVNIRGGAAEGIAAGLASKGVQITWADAVEVFYEYTLPQFGARAARALPGLERLHPHVRAILVSMIYNRGESMKPVDRYREKIAIRDLIKGAAGAIGDSPAGRRAEYVLYLQIAENLESMCRLWKPTFGVYARRKREAAGVRSIAAAIRETLQSQSA